MAMMASCSGSGEEPKNITPTTTEFSAGEVAKYVEVVDQPAELTYTEKEYHQYLRLKVTLKLIQDGIKDVDARDIHFQSSFLGGVYINLVDESGSRIDALSMRSEDDLKFKKFLTGNMGDTAVFVFEVNYGNDELARERFKNAVQFTPDETPTSIVLGGEVIPLYRIAIPAMQQFPAIAVQKIGIPCWIRMKSMSICTSRY